MARWIFLFLVLGLPGSALLAADWPQVGADATRSGYVDETLPTDMQLLWQRSAGQPPWPAWPRDSRLEFDRAFQVVAAGGRLFYGSSADHHVDCLDQATGDLIWTYGTDGPVRFAPAVWQDRLFVASDDGYLYCLAAADGRLIWRFRGGPDDRRLLGNEHMVSRWPARGGPVVRDNLVYFAAGIWPSDGIYLYALDAATGKVQWRNDDSGGIYMPQPHGGANARSGVSAQGYLVATGDKLYVPTGRAVPAAFERADGTLAYFHLQQNGKRGGAATLANDVAFFNGGLAFTASDGAVLGDLGRGVAALAGDEIIRGGDSVLDGFRLTEVERPDRKGELVLQPALERTWRVKDVPAGTALIVAGNGIVTTGGDRVALVDRTAGETTWSTTVDGAAHGLAVADGQLLVSTDHGTIYCFGSKNDQPPRKHAAPRAAEPYASDSPRAATARQILQASGVTDGLCVDLGGGDGELAYHLAQQSNLRIWVVESDALKVAQARRKLRAAGLYGTRVTVHQDDPTAPTYPQYFANLVVSSAALAGDAPQRTNDDEPLRLTRPFGGVECIGPADALQVRVRGALPGGGSWTHQYADPGNTCCTADTLVRGSLGMLWFRDVALEVPQRHGRGPAPLYYRGWLISMGLDEVMCVDGYNGRPLWKRPFPGILAAYDADHLMGTAGTGSPMCIGEQGLFVRYENYCLRLDPATGEVLTRFEVPQSDGGEKATWGFIATDQGVLFGSEADVGHVVNWRWRAGDMSQQFTESKRLFAFDAETGKLKWQYRAQHSIRHNAIAIGGGRVYLIDRPVAKFDLLEVRRGEAAPPQEHAPGVLLALAADTGEVVWRNQEQITGTMLALSTRHDALLMSHQRTRFELDSEKLGKALVVFSAERGERLWEKEANYASRPMINDRTIYAQGGAWDLLTGDPRVFNFERSYGCGILAGSEKMMVYRSATLGYFDLDKNEATENYGGMRPGCWINAIPAGGLVLVPDASAGCECSYLNRAWIALEPLTAR